ncbi:hypothetical protein FACS1894190_17510 [Spirochaetia bacterium]|nr:hypothetical protein FACS1894190_17510 [Spirochaetia bacterium]
MDLRTSKNSDYTAPENLNKKRGKKQVEKPKLKKAVSHGKKREKEL